MWVRMWSTHAPIFKVGRNVIAQCYQERFNSIDCKLYKATMSCTVLENF